MFDTDRLGLPRVQAAQAQKHVTVNAGLDRLDAAVQMTLDSMSQTVPPAVPAGVYGVPDGAVNAWAGRSGQIAFASNGGWEFLTPMRGWRAWISDTSVSAIFDGSDWLPGLITLTGNGAGLRLATFESTHEVGVGTSSTTAAFIPAHSMVFGVTGRIINEITGTAGSFELGVQGESSDRYGSGFGMSAGAWLRGLTSAPVTYYTDTALTLTASGGAFSGGRILLCAHALQIELPSL